MTADAERRSVLIAALSIAVAVTVLAVKYAAYRMTGSVALYSDAHESLVNVAAAVIAWLAVSWSRKPPDRDHPYGHHKAEYFSAVIEGVAIVVAALVILNEAWGAWRAPRVLTDPIEGVLVNAAATALNGVWCWVLLREGRRLRSPALAADGRHLLADVASSVGVAAGFLLAVATGWSILDPLLAGLVAVNVLWSGWRLVHRSVDALMDAAPDDEEIRAIREVISGHAEGAIEAHDLKARRAGRATFIEFHLVVPGTMVVNDAHAICDRIEDALHAHLPGSIVAIHIEPEDKAKQHGIVVLRASGPP